MAYLDLYGYQKRHLSGDRNTINSAQVPSHHNRAKMFNKPKIRISADTLYRDISVHYLKLRLLVHTSTDGPQLKTLKRNTSSSSRTWRHRPRDT